MRKILKKSGFVALILVVIIILFVIISYINHRVQLSKEDELFSQNIGEYVETDGYRMNIYMEGSGDTTLVFMSGSGTCSPVLDFKSLYSQLSDTYRIVVVEKLGYGFSDVADVERDIDTILFETRQALTRLSIEGPYVLCPHSMSGIEALYWTQQYPDEVTAIIGLDMAVPQMYDEFKINTTMIRLSAFASNVGITRWFSTLSESDAIKYGSLTEDEQELYRQIFYRRTLTQTMQNEIAAIEANAAKVADGGVPDKPILIFSSNGQGTGWSEKDWQNFHIDYITQCPQGSLIELDCSHYVHDIEYESIAATIKEYLD